ncbi:MAG: hypothetical protein ABEJ87_00340 [Candidatus Nanohalobium sp.]
MGGIKVSVPDDKEEKFREAAMKVFGHRRGSISKAAEKALTEWAERMNDEEINKSQGLGDSLNGNLADIEKSGLELQEERRRFLEVPGRSL